jgi:SulP family sulfate permease
MFMVAANTLEWKSLRDLHKIPKLDALVMVMTVAMVLTTNNLALGVLAGVVLSALDFGWKMSAMHAETHCPDHQTKVYVIRGQMFFATMMHFVDLFDVEGDPANVIMDFQHSHVWDPFGRRRYGQGHPPVRSARKNCAGHWAEC